MSDGRAIMYAAGALALLYVVTKAGDAAGALGSGIASGARAAEGVAVDGVGAIGAVFGLTPPSETIDDPQAVRYIIDTEGTFAASHKGTLSAFLKAMQMPAGSGRPVGTAGASVPSIYQRQADPAGATWAELSRDTVDPFDPRYYQPYGGSIYSGSTGLGMGSIYGPSFVGGLGSSAY